MFEAKKISYYLLFIVLASGIQTHTHNNMQRFLHAFNTALERMKKQDYDAALKSFETVLQLDPKSADAHFNVGLIYVQKNCINDAITAFEKCVTHNTHYIKAYKHLVSLYMQQENIPKTIWACKNVLKKEPKQKDILIHTARLLTKQGDINDAATHYRNAIQLDPDNLNLKLELGNTLCKNNYLDEALKIYREIVAKNQHAYPVFGNMAHVLRYQGKMKEAIPNYLRILKSLPNDAHMHYGLAESYLMLGNFKDGFKEFTYHWKRAKDIRNFSQNYWDGSDLNGKKILLRAEYGQGDTMQFIRYAQLLKKQGAYIIAEVQHTLVKLLSSCPYLDEVIPVNEHPTSLPDFDVQIPIMDLPYRCKTISEKTVPTNIPYIHADEELIQYWKHKIAADTRLKIGLCWQASSYYESFKTIQQRKSIPLAQFIPLAQRDDVSIYSLQIPRGKEQIEALPKNITINTYDDFDNIHGRFMDTAALIKNLDVIITIDTSIAHLAGALGKKVWVLLPQVSDWRWMKNRSDCPWYPTMRLFRQKESGNWQSVIQDIEREINTLIAQKPKNQKPKTSVHTEVSIGELVDKITILQIKNERIKDEIKLRNIRAELKTLQDTFEQRIQSSPELSKSLYELYEVNKKLWDIEDDIREKERTGSFDQEFIKIARSVYFTNDHRYALKRKINELLGSRLVEEKSYRDYKGGNG